MSPKSNRYSIKQQKEILWAILLLLLAFFFFTPRSVEYSDTHLGVIILFIIGFLLIPLAVVIILRVNKGTFKPYFLLYGLLTIWVVFMIRVFIVYKTESYELEHHGTAGKAIVTEVKPRVQLYRVQWRIKCSYVVNRHRYDVQLSSYKENTHKVGDTLDIIYNKEFPKMHRFTSSY